MLSLRKANIKDAELLFKWVNEKAVRSNSFSQESIKWMNHYNWCKSNINNKNCRMYILMNNDLEIGQIRFDYFDDYWLIDYSIDKKSRGKGLGYKILEKGILRFYTPVKFLAKVKINNIPSAKIFEKLNFKKKKSQNGYFIYTLTIN